MDASKVLGVYEVFTPTIPAKEAFVERERVTERLVDALRTPGKQVIIYGHSGSGKTTLIERKLFELYEHHITTSCIKGMTFEAVMLDAFDQLDPFYRSGGKLTETNGLTAELSAQWSRISVAKNQISEKQAARALPPQLTVQNLSRFAGAAKACWVLEDFHKLEAVEKVKLAQAMKMFMDMAKTYPEIKSVAVGAVGTAREVVQYDAEMRNRVAEIEVPLMEADELREIVRIGSKKLNVFFLGSTAETIVGFSNGLPSVCHQLCLSACLSAGVQRAGLVTVNIAKIHLDAAIVDYVESASDSIRERFDRAIRVRRVRKHDNYGLIVEALCKFDLDGAAVGEISRQVSKIKPDYKVNNINRYLRVLQHDDKGSVLRYDLASGKYSFSDPFVRSYALAYFELKRKQKRVSSNIAVDGVSLLSLVKKLMLNYSEVKDVAVGEGVASSLSDAFSVEVSGVKQDNK